MMRPYVFVLVAAGVLVSVSASFAAPPVKPMLAHALVVTAQPVKTLQPGGTAVGTLSRVNVQAKYLEVTTGQGVIRVPANAKLMMQNGENGPLVPTTLGDLNQTSALKVKVKIKITKGGIIVIISIRW